MSPSLPDVTVPLATYTGWALRGARRPTTAARARGSTSRSPTPRPSGWPAAIRGPRSRSAIPRSASTAARSCGPSTTWWRTAWWC